MSNNSLKLNSYNDNTQVIDVFFENTPLDNTLLQTDIDDINDNKINKNFTQSGGNYFVKFKYKNKIFEVKSNNLSNILNNILKKIKNKKQKSYTIYIKDKKNFIKHILYDSNNKLRLRKI